MNASLVFDGGEVYIPASMGTPLPDQAQGTPLEILGETCSRICYDSYGINPETGKRKGRSSAALHAHILEVINLSVYEHCTFTVRFPLQHANATLSAYLKSLVNRKGVWLELSPRFIDVTVNFRSVLEWDKYSKKSFSENDSKNVGDALKLFAFSLAPQIFGSFSSLIRDAAVKTNNIFKYSFLKPVHELSEDQAHVSLWLYGSRGFTHEQVRHRFSMSQRSTRYVKESESPWIVHPLISKFLNSPEVPQSDREALSDQIRSLIDLSRKTYDISAAYLQSFCENRGLDTTSARKQAYGASRGFLGNALGSEMIFTAPVSAWKTVMLPQRKSRFADAEIRQVYSPALDALKLSRFGHMFSEFETIPSPDGIGTVLK